MKHLPELPGRRTDLKRYVKAMHERPGEWVAIDKGPRYLLNGRASQWRRRGHRDLVGGMYEFTTRVTSKGRTMPVDGMQRVRLYGRVVVAHSDSSN